MNIKKIGLWVILISFSLFSSWTMWQIGYVGIWQAGIASSGSLQILLDLAISCLIICSWINVDARSRNINPYPWFVAVLTSGSLAILVYLIIREYQKLATQSLQTN
ncbi:MAG: hypothetical protein ACI84K_000174 [Pseudohongiellaceae bacterium]|jgi:hypothetical protein